MRRLTLAFLLLILGAPVLLATPRHSYLLREAAAATKEGDHAKALTKLEEAAQLRPDYPRLQLLLARTYAALERPDDALAALQRLADMGLRLKVSTDDALATLKDLPGFETIAKRLATGPAPVAVADEAAFTLPDVTGIIESCLVDPRTQVWYFGDVRNRCIWQRDASDGQLRKFTSDEDPLDGVFKLALSPDRRTLWASTATVVAMAGADAEDGKRSELIAFDFATGRVQTRYPVRYPKPNSTRKHLLGDFILAADGSVYATDSLSPIIWRLAPDGTELELWVESDQFLNLQGLTFSADERSLYVADYANGVWRIDVATKTPELLTAPANATFFGIDGLYAVSGGLLAVQSGVSPQRILRIEPAVGEASSAHVLASGRRAMIDLALGTVFDGRFHFVADSGWALFDPPPETPPAARSVTIYSTALE